MVFGISLSGLHCHWRRRGRLPRLALQVALSLPLTRRWAAAAPLACAATYRLLEHLAGRMSALCTGHGMSRVPQLVVGEA